MREVGAPAVLREEHGVPPTDTVVPAVKPRPVRVTKTPLAVAEPAVDPSLGETEEREGWTLKDGVAVADTPETERDVVAEPTPISMTPETVVKVQVPEVAVVVTTLQEEVIMAWVPVTVTAPTVVPKP